MRAPLVERFHAFYNENKEKLHMKQSFPINWREVMRWKSHLTEPDSIKLGEHFIATLQHVPFSQFYDALVKAALAIKEERIILVINGNMRKSSAWVALLVWPFINNKVVDIIAPQDMKSNVPDRHIHVYVDDAVYSGKQFVNAIPASFSGDIYLLTAAVSGSDETANRLEALELRGNPVKVLLPVSRIRFFSVFEYSKYDREWSDRVMYNNYDKFQYRDDVHAIYFDHKLADAVSVMQKVIALGVDDVKEDYHFHPIIQGCKPTDYRYYDKKIVDSHEYVSDFDPDGVCPTAFYKNIDYTLNGNLVSTLLHILDIL